MLLHKIYSEVQFQVLKGRTATLFYQHVEFCELAFCNCKHFIFDRCIRITMIELFDIENDFISEHYKSVIKYFIKLTKNLQNSSMLYSRVDWC